MRQELVSENDLIAHFYRPEGAPRRAIILLGGSEGGLRLANDPSLFQPLLALGHPVLVLAYFGCKPLPPALDRIPLEYFERAFDWLATQPGVIPHEYALVGLSKGGELALLLASRYLQVRATVAAVPSHVVWQGIPSGSNYSVGSSWSCAGKELPYVPISPSLAVIWGLMTRRFLQSYTQSLKNEARVAQAAIPVEQAKGPLLLISAKQDTMWPSTCMCERIVERLAANHFPFFYQHLALESPHQVMKSSTFWPEVTRFLEEHFPG